MMLAAFGGLTGATLSLGMKGGYNAQNCNSVNVEERPEWRFGLQAGVDCGIFFPRGCQPLQFGLETGLFYQNDRYASAVYGMPSGDLEFNDILIPLLVTLKENISAKTDIIVGMGWAITKHLNAYYGSLKIPGEDFSIGQAFVCKAEVSFKIHRKLYLQPSLYYQIHLIEDYSALGIRIENARSFNLNLGLSYAL